MWTGDSMGFEGIAHGLLTLFFWFPAYELMRPFLHEFLTQAYEDYDIVIWSATGMKWIEEKMRLLGVSTHQDYKVLFYLDYLAMITVHTTKYGTIDVSIYKKISVVLKRGSVSLNT